MVQFDKEAVKAWRRAVHKEFRCWRLPSEDPIYRAGMVLAAVYGFGTDVAVLVEVSGQMPEFVRGVLKRARANRILVGQRLRVGWNDKRGIFAVCIDAMTAQGEIVRVPDPKRSAAQTARRKPEVRRAPRRPRVKPIPGATFSPKVVDANPLVGLPEWNNKQNG